MKTLATVALLLLTAETALAREPKPSFAVPHLGTNQTYRTLNGDVSKEETPLVAENNGESEVWASVMPKADRVIRLVLAIENVSDKTILFTPSAATVRLPNGHSYLPFSQTDAIQALVRDETARRRDQSAGYNPPAVDTVNTNCNDTGYSINCTSKADTGQQSGYNAGYALGSAISNIIAKHHLNKAVAELQKQYFTSREFEPSKDPVDGYIDLYIEDLNSGPFTIELPVGSKTYTFVFGPRWMEAEIPKN